MMLGTLGMRGNLYWGDGHDKPIAIQQQLQNTFRHNFFMARPGRSPDMFDEIQFLHISGLQQLLRSADNIQFTLIETNAVPTIYNIKACK